MKFVISIQLIIGGGLIQEDRHKVRLCVKAFLNIQRPYRTVD